MATAIFINLHDSVNTAPQPPWHNGFNILTVGELTADLVDEDNVGTGYSFDIVNVAFSGPAGGPGVATSGAGGWPDTVFDEYFFSSGSPQFEFGGLNEGDTYELELAGHEGVNAARETDFTVTPANEGTTQYDNSGTSTPNAPITFTGTIGAAGTLNIAGALVDNFWHINGLKLTLTTPAVGDFLPASHSTVMIRV